jgi:hypothetical protein
MTFSLTLDILFLNYPQIKENTAMTFSGICGDNNEVKREGNETVVAFETNVGIDQIG